MATHEPTEEAALREEVAALRRRVAALEDDARELARCREELGALRSSEAELRAMFGVMTDLVFVMDGRGTYLKVATNVPELLYRPTEEVIGKRMHEVLPADTADHFLGYIQRALQTEQVVTLDYSLPMPGGEAWFSAKISPLTRDSVVFVCRDVSERKRYEDVLRDSLRQQEELRAQEAALAELSTPLIPISAAIVVMPLVGRLDAARMHGALEALLQGIERRRARVAILDITGVPELAAESADAVVRAARAVQLLGAEVVLTGIRPDVAQRLVDLDVDLRGIATRGTLQDGIAHAMASTRASRR